MIIRETEFLLDDKILAEIKEEGKRDQVLDRLNVLRKVLSIPDSNELKRLIFLIYKEARVKDEDEDKDESKIEEENDEESEVGYVTKNLN